MLDVVFVYDAIFFAELHAIVLRHILHTNINGHVYFVSGICLSFFLCITTKLYSCLYLVVVQDVIVWVCRNVLCRVMCP